MGFGWDLKRDPCADAVRAAAGQLRVALRELRGARADADVAVHEARKALRRCRALGELLRPLADGDRGGDLIASLRGARRLLSDARDRAVLRAALRAAWRERVGPGGGREGRAPGSAIAPLRALLEAKRDPASARVDPAVAAAVAAALEGARHDLTRLHAAATAVGGDLAPLGRGLRRMHRRARAAAGTALAVVAAGADGDGVAALDVVAARDHAGGVHDDALHDARKRFKELGYVMRWWAPAWRGPIEAWLVEADALGDLIGRDHDQVVLRSHLRAMEGAVDGELLAQVLAGSERLGGRLRARAGRVLLRLAAEPSDAFVARHLAVLAAARAPRAPRGDA